MSPAGADMVSSRASTAWIDVGRCVDVPMLEGRSVTVAGRRVAVFRLRDGWAAVDGVCPHRGGPLADGLVADCSVTCPLHNRRFDLVSGHHSGDEALAVAVHEIREASGRLLLRLAEPA